MTILVSSTTNLDDKNFWATNWFCFYDAVRLYGRPFRQDVAAELATRKVLAYISPEKGDDALALDWEADWWCNPPFDLKVAFIERAAKQARAGRGGMMLLPYEPLTDWWRDGVAPQATFIYEPDGRYNFLERDGVTQKDGVNFGVALVLFSPHRGPGEAVRIPYQRTQRGLGKRRIRPPATVQEFPAFCQAIAERDLREALKREFEAQEQELERTLALADLLPGDKEREQHQANVGRLIRQLKLRKLEAVSA